MSIYSSDDEVLMHELTKLIYKMPELGIKTSIISNLSIDEQYGLKNFLTKRIEEKQAN